MKRQCSTFYNLSRGLRIMALGDQVVVKADADGKSSFAGSSPPSPQQASGASWGLGPAEHDDKEGAILNRIIRWMSNQVSFAASPKQMENILQDISCAGCEPNIVPVDGEGSQFCAPGLARHAISSEGIAGA